MRSIFEGAGFTVTDQHRIPRPFWIPVHIRRDNRRHQELRGWGQEISTAGGSASHSVNVQPSEGFPVSTTWPTFGNDLVFSNDRSGLCTFISTQNMIAARCVRTRLGSAGRCRKCVVRLQRTAR